jgi:hypothetical protein
MARKKARARKRKAAKPTPAAPKLTLRRQTVRDLSALLKETARVRQSKKVCVA